MPLSAGDKLGYDWNWAAAEKEFKRAIELSPNNSDAHTYYSWFLAPLGRNDQVVAEAKRAQQADPLSGFAAFSVGAALVFARRWDPTSAATSHSSRRGEYRSPSLLAGPAGNSRSE